MQRYKSERGRELIYESYNKLLAAWGVAYEEADIPTTYGSTHIITAGSSANPPLLLLHGTADNAAMMWIYNIQPLSEQFYIIAIDAVGGSGKSEPNAAYKKQFDQAVWLDEVLDALAIRQADIAGVSYGAYLAYHYAIMRPSRVDKIVCMAGRVPSSQFEVMGKMMKAFLPEALFPTEASCKRLLRKLSGPNYAVFEDNKELMQHWFYLLKHFNNKSMMQHKITIFQAEQLASIRDKALFLIGDQDRLSYYPKAITKLEEHRLTYKIIPQAGHAINHEQSEQVNAEIIRYLIG
ncbi:alpha/beta fold hydrolase [Paenibacillus radicis (ex Gao et al. 2016)]|uniref:Carboxylesterase nap n=1 Tax=Paenibacillus radicis (ex Gao et al. 2016) TaxID=1737354 RepID=A0A917LX26_9BACL|nr:alpha/beta hydrolase [Paenibacillus radicis (ex Gao et al. 2016)]GGG61042.1 putative carboxylesterase nap [Paenibacillus radicis (ex Gao et al. 2016)]